MRYYDPKKKRWIDLQEDNAYGNDTILLSPDPVPDIKEENEIEFDGEDEKSRREYYKQLARKHKQKGGRIEKADYKELEKVRRRNVNRMDAFLEATSQGEGAWDPGTRPEKRISKVKLPEKLRAGVNEKGEKVPILERAGLPSQLRETDVVNPYTGEPYRYGGEAGSLSRFLEEVFTWGGAQDILAGSAAGLLDDVAGALSELPTQATVLGQALLSASGGSDTLKAYGGTGGVPMLPVPPPEENPLYAPGRYVREEGMSQPNSALSGFAQEAGPAIGTALVPATAPSRAVSAVQGLAKRAGRAIGGGEGVLKALSESQRAADAGRALSRIAKGYRPSGTREGGSPSLLQSADDLIDTGFFEALEDAKNTPNVYLPGEPKGSLRDRMLQKYVESKGEPDYSKADDLAETVLNPVSKAARAQQGPTIAQAHYVRHSEALNEYKKSVRDIRGKRDLVERKIITDGEEKKYGKLLGIDEKIEAFVNNPESVTNYQEFRTLMNRVRDKARGDPSTQDVVEKTLKGVYGKYHEELRKLEKALFGTDGEMAAVYNLYKGQDTLYQRRKRAEEAINFLFDEGPGGSIGRTDTGQSLLRVDVLADKLAKLSKDNPDMAKRMFGPEYAARMETLKVRLERAMASKNWQQRNEAHKAWKRFAVSIGKFFAHPVMRAGYVAGGAYSGARYGLGKGNQTGPTGEGPLSTKNVPTAGLGERR